MKQVNARNVFICSVLIEKNKPLQQLNTFGIDVSAGYFAEVKSVEDFLELRTEKIFLQNEKLILGGGSNILFTKCFDGLVIKNSIEGIAVVSETETEVVVKANSGVVWHELVLWCIDKNYGGIENLSLIPGLVGAAPMQNIGAYGAEIKDVFDELDAIEISSGETVKFILNDCAFGYRESGFKNKFKNKFIITSVSLRLSKISSPNSNYKFKTDYGDVKKTLEEMSVSSLSLKAVSDAVCKIRNSKLPSPKEIGNAGSFFKNPVIEKNLFDALLKKFQAMPHYPAADSKVKIPAGWLIEQCGWKGKRIGNTGSHTKQALVLVNYGNASGEEILNLSKEIQQSVKEKFGIDIETEVNVV